MHSLSATRRRSAAALGVLAALMASAAAAADEPTWTLMGRQGIVQMVLVPVEQARDEPAYARQIKLICGEGVNCFLNFHTNSRSVPVAVPLPDEISSEITATYRKTYKKGVPQFSWSCRMQMIADSCF